MRRELTRREMQVLAFVGRHDGETYPARDIASVLGLAVEQVGKLLRVLRREELIDYEPADQPTTITAAGRKMLWPIR